MKLKLSVIGLGKLGSTMSACFISKGFEVIGVDKNQRFVDTINRGQSPIYEPHVKDMLKKYKGKIRATVDIELATLNTDVSFIIVPTPSMSNGLFSTKYVEDVMTEMAKAIKIKDSYHLVVITSTVLPGDTAKMSSLLEKLSGKKLNKDFGLVYNPDFIALGKIVHDFLNPDMILIGESDEKAGDFIEQIHVSLVDNDPKIFRMNWYNAELSKISLNSYCTLKITYANVIAEICESMPGGDAETVLKAIGSDSRIGNKYFKGGLGYAGPCLKPEGLVQTDKGLIEIQNIKKGDRVITHKGRYRKVTKVFKRPYTGVMLKIISKGFSGNPIVLTPEHPVWGIKDSDEKKNSGKFSFIPVDGLGVGDFVVMPVLSDGFAKKTDIDFGNIKIKNGSMLSIIESVEEESYEGNVHNLEVEEDNSYMLESGVVHNCFPRDNRALSKAAESLGVTETFCDLTDSINNYHKTDRICNVLIKILKEKKISEIAVLGLSYKEDTPLIEESVSIEVIKTLTKYGVDVIAYDPAAMLLAEKEFSANSAVLLVSSVLSCIRNQSVCFIATPWKKFSDIKIEQIKDVMGNNPVILDAWGVLSFPDNCGLDIRRLGKNNRDL